MNPTGKKYDSLSQSSLLALKAELVKKRSELKNPKNTLPSGSSPKSNKPPINTIELVPGTEEHHLADKIHESLLEKASKYRKILYQSTLEDFDLQEDSSLIDFARIPVDETERLLSRINKELEENENCVNIKELPHQIEPTSEENMIEITDEYGRSRMVPRHEVVNYTSQFRVDPMDEDKIHYSEDFEIRTKSVSFYKFSSIEALRTEQMGALRALDSLSQQQRAAIQKVKDSEQELRKARRELILQKRTQFLHNPV